MDYKRKIDDDLKGALKDRDQVRLMTLRSVKTALRNKEVELNRELEETEFFQVVNTLAKQRRESIEQFEKGGRQDLSDAEKRELEILVSYLPRQMDDAELTGVINEAISEAGAAHPKDMGKVMKIVMGKVAGRADGKKVSALVNKLLQPKKSN